MSGNGPRVAVVTGASQGIGAGLVAGYRAQGWSVVANSLTIKPSGDPEVLTVRGDERGADRACPVDELAHTNVPGCRNAGFLDVYGCCLGRDRSRLESVSICGGPGLLA